MHVSPRICHNQRNNNFETTEIRNIQGFSEWTDDQSYDIIVLNVNVNYILFRLFTFDKLI